MIYKYFLIYILSILLVYSYYLGHTPLLVLLIFIIASSLTYLIYAKDKRAAQNGEWRTSENTLHLFSLLCGWPGAIIAQKRLRHKTKKTSFLLMFWLTLFINMGVFSWLHTEDGAKVLHTYIYKLEYILVTKINNNNAVTAILVLTKFRSNKDYKPLANH